jgi:hypothetical protein
MELAALVRTRSFSRIDRESDIKKYVTFLSASPRRSSALPPVSEKEGLEALALAGREVLVISRGKPNGLYGFPNGFVEKAFGMKATTRNWSTVTRIVEAVVPTPSTTVLRSGASGTGTRKRSRSS